MQGAGGGLSYGDEAGMDKPHGRAAGVVSEHTRITRGRPPQAQPPL